MKHLLIAACAMAILATGCDTYSYPTPELTQEEMKKNERVYGDVGGEPKHHKLSYAADPDQPAKADEIKKKLFAEAYATERSTVRDSNSVKAVKPKEETQAIDNMAGNPGKEVVQ